MRYFSTFLFTVAIALFVMSCGPSRIANTQQGTEIKYKPGFPEFYMNSFGYINNKQEAVIEVTTDIIKGSLTYKQFEDSLSANVTADIQIIDLDNGDNIIKSKRISRTVTTTDQNINSSRETINLSYHQQVPPSNYRITVVVEDHHSGRKLSNTTETYIPKATSNTYALSSIQMAGKTNGDSSWTPITNYNVQSSVDSLRFIFQIISPQSSESLIINTRLIKIKSDTGLPRSISLNNYSTSTIEYKGIEYDEETELQSNRRVLSDYSSTFVEYKFENKARGNYRFEVNTQKDRTDNEETEETKKFKARAFGVKSSNFPTIKSAQELARPLVYLMDEDDYEAMMNIEDTDSLKQTIDRFWLRNIGNKKTAQHVIELFYNRVEEANKQFSNFKEGWKTDRGMIYVLFGEPWYTRDRLKRVSWYYSYNMTDPEYQFRFEQPKLNNKFFPFDHYVLQRQRYYHNRYYYQKQLWLSGRILQRRI